MPLEHPNSSSFRPAATGLDGLIDYGVVVGVVSVSVSGTVAPVAGGSVVWTVVVGTTVGACGSTAAG